VRSDATRPRPVPVGAAVPWSVRRQPLIELPTVLNLESALWPMKVTGSRPDVPAIVTRSDARR
jgi:hypothetical protein